tara:strand:- start:1101 stop:1304 length:204 start_codon:yes stop_codon:yes gene_type:complete
VVKQGMTTKQINEAIENVMTETNCDKLEAMSALQTAATKMGNEKLIEQLGDMKMEEFLAMEAFLASE